MKEVIHIHEEFEGVDNFREWEKENAANIWSPSRLATLTSCPRKYQHRYVDKISERDKPIMLTTGSVIHVGLHRLMITDDPDQAVSAMREVWTDPGPLRPEDQHMTLAHLEIVIRNYHDFWKRHSTYKPYRIRYDDLDKSNLLAARWIMTDEGDLILGESTMLMRFGEHPNWIYLKGIPDDLFETPSGNLYVVDHKSTGGWISNYWAMKYRISDQFRIYTLMLVELLGRPIAGTILDAVYTGKYASSPKSKAVKFDRREYIYDETMLQETLRNVKSQIGTVSQYEDTGYYPQFTGLYCGGCTFLETHCKHPIWARDDMTGLKVNTKHHSMLDPRED